MLRGKQFCAATTAAPHAALLMPRDTDAGPAMSYAHVLCHSNVMMQRTRSTACRAHDVCARSS